MLQPINNELVYRFLGNNIDTTNDLPTDGIGDGSEAYDAADGKTYILAEGSWVEKK